ncbi:MAG: DUF86 domain-containing protein [Bacteroidales bacterium]|jgi:uncharacterized protein with HEPN domain|nr:DUF86 domain-containing protein [Bacteroidales bacterium]
MRENVRDRNRLEHMIEAIDCILDFADGKTKGELEADRLRYFGVIKNIEIIGEAAYKLTRAFCRKYSDTPWEFIAKMRHVLVHDYYQIDALEVWKVIRDDIRPLREQIAKYLAEVNWSEWEKNEAVIAESATQKSLRQMAIRMKQLGYDIDEICRITSLKRDDVDAL